MSMEQERLTRLIEQARKGDQSAQEALLAAIQDRVYYHCRKMLKHEQDAQDTAQDVLIAVLTGLDKLREPRGVYDLDSQRLTCPQKFFKKISIL